MNKQVKIEWTLGNFNVVSTMEMDDAQQAAAMSLGALYLHQRVSEVDKKLGCMTSDIALAKPGSKGNGPWRRADYERGKIPFSTSRASALVGCFAKLPFPKEFPGVGELLPTAVITEYVNEAALSEAAKLAKAEAELHTECVAFLTKKESEDTLESWVESKLAWVGETHGEDGEFLPALLESAKAKMREHRAKVAAVMAAAAAKAAAEVEF